MNQNRRAAAVLWLALCSACSVYDPRLASEQMPQTAAGRSGRGGGGSGAVAGQGGGTLDPDCDPLKERPTCMRANADASCVSGQCLIADCKAPWVDCDQDDANGCEATLDSPEHCGLCAAACRFNHASASCKDGRCALADCDHGYADCDGDDDNGCETALDSLDNCGGCGKTCPTSEQALLECKDGKCSVASCVGSFGDCNHDAADGCELALTTSDDCGGCGTHCNPENAAASDCGSGSCTIGSCTMPYADCNGASEDGCEGRLDRPANCGSCGAKCELPNVEREACNVASGAARCLIDHGCAPDDASCKPGVLSNGCQKGFSDCDQKPENGCEVDLSRLNSCGECGQSCVVANTLRECKDGECATRECAPGYGMCDGQTDCKSLQNDVNHCGDCNTKCGTDKPNCVGGKCTAETCGANRADCNNDNGCETDLTNRASCGGCGLRCALPHASSNCNGGACTLGNCDNGWANCDGDPTNGCEIDLSTTSDCGGCGVICAFPNAEPECREGRCQPKICSPGRGDCNNVAADGCESDLTLPTSCGDCGNVCARLDSVVSSSCGEGGCAIVCQAGRENCDGMPSNGCEAVLTNPSTCGACGNDCGRLPNVDTAACSNGACRDLKCAAGFADCNGNPADGCERSIRSLTDCGSCNRACAPAHATGSCSNGTCGVERCDSGFGDCDSNVANGCEAPLSTQQNCGACANACAGGVSCNNGSCGCTSDQECGSGKSCCNGMCAGTEGSCFPYPCIPSTDRNRNALNCGGCGMLCLLWCCGALGDITP